MRLLRWWFTYQAYFLWIAWYFFTMPVTILVLIVLLFNPQSNGDSVDAGATIAGLIGTAFVWPGLYYASFVFQVTLANAFSRAMGQPAILSYNPGFKFRRSLKKYKSVYTGELKSDVTPEEQVQWMEQKLKAPEERPTARIEEVTKTITKYAQYPGGDLHHEITQLTQNLSAGPVRTQSLEILATLETIYENFKKDEDDIKKSTHILPSLLGSMLNILRQYATVDGIAGVSRSKEKVETEVLAILQKLSDALKRHLNNLLENDMVSLETEIGLLKSLIRSEGLDTGTHLQ